MTRPRIVLGVAAGALLIGSGAAHSLLGWPALTAELARAEAPADLVDGLAIGWHFGGLAMVVFGAIAISLFVDRLRGRPAALRPVLLIALANLTFGGWALIDSGFEPMFLSFVIPALMLLGASLGASDAPPSAPRRDTRG